MMARAITRNKDMGDYQDGRWIPRMGCAGIENVARVCPQIIVPNFYMKTPF